MPNTRRQPEPLPVEAKLAETVEKLIESRQPCMVKLSGISRPVVLVFTAITDVAQTVGNKVQIRKLVSAKNMMTKRNMRKFYASRIIAVKELSPQEIMAITGGMTP